MGSDDEPLPSLLPHARAQSLACDATLNQLYAEYFNRRHHRVGHLFQGRFKAFLVDSESYFLEVARYVVLNPVRAGMRKTAGGYRWSSYRATAGLEPAPDWLAPTSFSTPSTAGIAKWHVRPIASSSAPARAR